MTAALARCDDGFYPRCCPNRGCKHFDGAGIGRAPVEPRFLYCSGCAEAIEGQAIPTSMHGRWHCRACAFCHRCGSAPRRKRSLYCGACLEILAAPKPCAGCGELMHIRRGTTGLGFAEHIKRTRHLRCQISTGAFKVAWRQHSGRPPKQSDDELIETLASTRTVRQAAQLLGYAHENSIYARAKRRPAVRAALERRREQRKGGSA